MKVVSLEDYTVRVKPFSNEYEAMPDIKVGTVETVYTHPTTGEAFILVINQALIFGDKIQNSLLTPNQMRSNGVTVSDVPKQFDSSSAHAIIATVDDNGEKVTLPLRLRGVISFLDTEHPTACHADCRRITLTSNDVWNPYSDSFSEQESRITSSMTCPTYNAGQYKLSDQMQVSLKDALDAGKIQQPLRLNAVCTDTPFTPDMVVINRLLSSVNIVNDDVRGDGTTGWNDSSVCGVMSYQDRAVMGMSSKSKTSILTKELLSSRWGIGLESAKRTLQVTTQFGLRHVIHPYDKRYKTTFDHMRFPTLAQKYYSDTMFVKLKSLQQNKCAQVFTDGGGDIHVYPIQSKSQAPEALMNFIQDVGVPRDLVTDGAKEETLGRWKEIVKKFRIHSRASEAYSQWQNLAEGGIRELKRLMHKHRLLSNSPARLWDYLCQWCAAIRRLTAGRGPNSRAPAEKRLGDTPDISEYAQFHWYQYVWYIDPGDSNKKKLARHIGVAPNIGAKMTWWILPTSCKIIARSSVTPVLREELDTTGVQEQIKAMDISIQAKIGDKVLDKHVDSGLDLSAIPIKDLIELHSLCKEDDDIPLNWDPLEPESSKPEADDYTAEGLDEYLQSKVLIPIAGELKRGSVLKRKRDEHGLPYGSRHEDPVLDTREYVVEFDDGELGSYTTNSIATSMFSQVDPQGHETALLEEICDHNSSSQAVCKDDGFITSKSGKKTPRKTTVGWALLCKWKDRSFTWVPLKDLKESNPIEVAEYAINNKISEEPAFAWWVKPALRVRDRYIRKVKTAYLRRTHKYGIEMPKTTKRALELDVASGTTYWRDAIEKEMKNVMIAFEFPENGNAPIGSKKIEVNMVFDVKAMTLTRKARLVAGGHKTEVPKDSVYSSVVSRESVRIAFLVAALNDLKIEAADIQNAYLNAPTREKVHIVCGPEFGHNQGRVAVIVRALYGLRSSGACFRQHLAQNLRDMHFKACRADPDVWMRKALKPCGFEYWEYVLCYVDDVLCISHDPDRVMKGLELKYILKPGSVKEPDLYLGAKISKYYIDGSPEPDKPRWSMSSDEYVKQSIINIEAELSKINSILPKRVSTPLAAGYRPELDSSKELNARQISFYQGLIGTLRWICELGRIDIVMPTTLMASHMMCPRAGHLEQTLHMFAYLKQFNRSRLVFDETEPDFADTSTFVTADWAEFYPDAEEAIPLNVPEARGNSVMTSAFVDADHAGCKVTRRSHTGILIFVNRAPIFWFSKRQNTVESSTFGSEYIAMRQAIDYIVALRYKLRMMGIPFEGPTNVFCDNNAVVINSTRPESTLKRKHNSVAYHRVREAQAGGIVRIAKEGTSTNLADMLTKLLAGPKLRELAGAVMW